MAKNGLGGMVGLRARRGAAGASNPSSLPAGTLTGSKRLSLQDRQHISERLPTEARVP